MELRAYQTEAIDRCREAFHARGEDGAFLYLNVLLVLPTGGGKTVCFADIAKKSAAHGTKTLILAHRVELIRQASAKLTSTGVAHGVIAPGYPLTDDIVQVGSVQTMAARIGHPCTTGFGLIVPDEGHHAVAPQYQAVFAANPNARILPVTATPQRLDGRGLGREAGGFVDFMVVGPSIGWLQDQGHLCRAKVFAPPGKIAGPDLTDVGKTAGDYARGKLAQAMGGKTLTGDAVEHYRQHADGKAAICYCVNVAHAQSVAETFRTAGYRAVAVSGESKAADRDAAIGGLETGATQVLCAADLVSEGLDVPLVECVILLRPTASLTLYMQQVGRGLRPAYGKPYLVVLDHSGNAHRHGLPSDNREWSLNGRAPGKAKPAALVQCPECYRVDRPSMICEECGHEFKADKTRVNRRSLRVVAGELVELEAATPETSEARKRIDDRRARAEAARTKPLKQLVAEARSYEDLVFICSARGLKPGWLWYAAQERGFVRSRRAA